MMYNTMYNSMPPILFNQPSIAISKVFSISLPPIFTNTATTINTMANEIKGSQDADIVALFCRYTATTEDNLSAAASPNINATIEKMATISPF